MSGPQSIRLKRIRLIKKKTQEQNAFSNKEGNTRNTNRDLTTRQNMPQQSPIIRNPSFLAMLSHIFNFAQYLFCDVALHLII